MDFRSKNNVHFHHACIVLALLSVMGGFASNARSDGAPLAFSYQARVYDSTGTIPITEEVKVVFGIYSPDGNCLLYEEIKNGVDLSSSNGLISLEVGSLPNDSSRTINDPGLSMVKIYANTGTSILAVGSPLCTTGYQPSFGDPRLLKVKVYNHAGILISTVNDSINSVPSSLVAETLQGLAADKFIQVATGVTQVNLDTITNGSDALTLHQHDGRYMPLSGVGSDVFFSGANRIGIGTNTSAADIGFGGGVPRTIQVDRNSAGNGNSLSLEAGGGQSGATNRMGGKLILSSGFTTGSGKSNIELQTSGSNVSGSGDNSPTTKMVILGNGNVGIGVLNPVKALEVNGDAKATQFCLLGVCIGDWTLAGKGGTVTTVTAGMGILKDGVVGANLTVAGTLSVDAGTTNGKIARVGAGNVVPLSIIPVIDSAHIGSQAVTTAQIANGTIKVEDLNTTDTDGRYVLKTGYTMTGQLVLPTNGLAVGGTQLVASGGSVGIGTSSPTANLEVRESGSSALLQTIKFGDSSGAAHLGAGSAYYGLSNSAKTSNLAILQSNGNVGIGLTNPSAKLEVNGTVKATSVDIESVRHYYEARTLPTAVNSTVDIGVFSIVNSGNDLDIAITVTDFNFSVSKRYIIPTQFGGVPAWSLAVPLSSSSLSNPNDFSLEVLQNDGPNQLSLRIRRTLGTTAGTAAIHMQQRGSTAATFTPSLATASGVAAVTTLVGSTILSQAEGKAGVGTAAPANKLSVVGNASIGYNGESAPANGLIVSGNVGIGTATPTATLEVRSATPSIIVGKPDASDGALYLGNTSQGIKRNFNGVTNDVGVFTSGADLYLSGNNGTATNQFVVKSTGAVGIGTNSPSSVLDVGGTGNTAYIQNLSTWGLNARAQGLSIMPEGSVTDNGAGAITFGSTILVMAPLSGSYIRVAAGTYNLGNWGALWVPIPSTGTRGLIYTPTVAAWSDIDRNFDGRDRVLLAQRNGTGKIYTRFTRPGNRFEDFVSTTTSATPVSLSAGSAPRQQFIGSANQTVILPVATTLAIGQTYSILNRSTGTITVKASDGTTTLLSVPPTTQNTFIASSIASANGSWDISSNAGINVTAVTGTLPVGNGGTGSTAALVPGGIMYGSSSSVATTAAAGTAGHLLVSGGAGAPTWATSPSLTSLILATALPIGSGGTGAATKIPAFNALSPMTTLGDIIFGGAAGTGTRLAGNTTPTKQFLISTGSAGLATAPVWGTLSPSDLPAITLTGDVSGSAASGSITTAIGAGKVTNTMLAGSIASSKLVGTDIATVGTITSGTWNGTGISETRGGTNQTSYATGDTLYASGTNTVSKLAGNSSTTRKFLTQTGNGSVSAAPTWSSSIPGMNFTGAINSDNGTSAGGQQHFIMQTGGTPRFAYGLKGTDLGSNIGSDFFIWNYSDAGTFLGTPLTIQRNTGNVGIGTSNPTATLEVRSATPSIIVGKSDISGGALYLGNSDYGIKRNYNAANDVGVFTTDADLYLSGSGTASNQFVLKNSGNVGIGTNTPGSLLTVGGGSFPMGQSPGINVGTNGDSYVTVSDNTRQVILGADVSGTGMVGTYSNHDFAIRSNNLERIRVAAGGNVGIGTATPTTALDVNGVLKATSVDIASVRHYYETRTLPTVADSIVEIGKFYQQHSGISLDVNITVSAANFTVSKRYMVSSQYANNSGTWRTVLPLADTGHFDSNDFELEMLQVDSPNHELNMRIRRVGSGTNIGVANVHIQSRGASNALFTASSATASGVAATSGNFGSTVLTQLDSKAGIGTKSPANTLSVLGNASIGYNGNTAPASSLIVSGNVGVGTATPAAKLTIEGYGEILRLENPAGLHNYLAYFIDGGGGARSGWIGYRNNGDIDLSLTNEKTGGGDILLLPNSGRVGINTDSAPAGSLAIGNSADGDAFKIGAAGTRHHLVSNRDMVFNSLDYDTGVDKTAIYNFRKNTAKFDELTFVELLAITDQGWLGLGTIAPNAPFHVASTPIGTAASANPAVNGVQIQGGDLNSVAGIDLTTSGGLGTPYIDFKNDTSGANDFDTRLILTSDNQLNVNGGDLLVNGNKITATQFCFPGNVCTTNWGAGGSLANLATGSGLTGGPITTTGTISVPTDGITSTHLAAGTVALTDMNLTDVDTRYVRKTNADNVAFGTISLTAPAGDLSPTITARTVPAGQGASSEKTELILFHADDYSPTWGPDQITLRAPAISFQTFNNATVGNIANNSGFIERMFIVPDGYVGIGTSVPNSNLEVKGPGGSLLETIRFGDTTGYAHIGAGALYYGFSNQSKTPDLAILQSNGNVGIGTTTPSVKLEVNGTIKATNMDFDSVRHYYETRTLPVVVNSTVDIGAFSIINSGNDLDVAITVTSTNFSASKRYIIPTQYGGVPAWSMAVPMSNSNMGNANDFALEVFQNDGPDQLSLRIRRTLGTTAGTAIIHMQQRGSSATSFTPSSTSAAGVAAVTAKVGSTVLTQMNGKVGFGTEAPNNSLHIKGTVDGEAGILNENTSTGSSAYTLNRISSDTGRLALFTNSSTRALDGGAGNTNIRTDNAGSKLFLSAGGGQTVAIDSTGKVGIGTVTPAQQLHTTGTARFDGGVQVDGNPVIDADGGWHRSYGDTGWYNETYGGGMYMTDTTWIKVYGSKFFWSEGAYLGTTGSLGVGINNPANKADVQVQTRTGTHPTGKALYVTSDMGTGGALDGGFEVRHSNGTQGIGMGSNTIYATGINTDQLLGLQAKGTSPIQMNSFTEVIGSNNFRVTSGNVYADQFCFNGGACTTTWGAGGTVTNVATGSGLTGGPITSTGTVSVATAGITAAHLAADVDTRYVNAEVGGDTMTGNLMVPKISVGPNAVEANVDINAGTADTQATITSGAFTYGAEKADLVLTRRHGIFTTGYGFPASLIDFRGTNSGGTEASLAQIMGVYDTNGGSNYSGGLTFLTSPGGSTDPAGRRNFGAAPITRMLIDRDGKVGIGTNTPATLLNVGSGTFPAGIVPGVTVGVPTASYLTVSDNTRQVLFGSDATGGGYGMVGAFSNHDFVTRTNNLERVRINAAGNVGIAQANPTYKLDVTGNANISSTLNVVNSFSLNSGFPANNYVGGNLVLSRADTHSLFGTTNNFDLLFITNSSEKMRLTNAGRLGIGTTAPTATLDVLHSSTPSILVGTSVGTLGAVYLGNTSNGIMRNYSTGSDVGVYSTAGDLYLSGAGAVTNQFVLKNSGNVGIGTASPNNKLEISGGAFSIYHPGNWTAIGLDYDSAANGGLGQLRFRSNNGSTNLNQTNMVINKMDGKVGIGTVAPAQQLHVAGIGRFDGGIQAGGGVSVIDSDGSWHRSQAGATGLYNQTYGGGWNMADATYVRAYGDKNLFIPYGSAANPGTDVTTVAGVYIGKSGNGDTNIELAGYGSTGKTPYIDFTRNSGVDYDARMILTGNDLLEVLQTDFKISGGGSSAGKAYANQLCINGGSCISSFGGGGSVTSVTAGTGLSGGTITTSGTISANFGTSAGTIAEGNDSRLSNSRSPNGGAGGDLTGSYPSPTVASLGGQAASTIASGTLLAYNSTSGNSGSQIVRRDGNGDLNARYVNAIVKFNANSDACSAGNVGSMRFVAGGSGVSDKMEACLKSSGGSYAWSDLTAGGGGGSGISCQSLYAAGNTTDGIYTINPAGTPFSVYCDMTHDGGGWALASISGSGNAILEEATTGLLDPNLGVGNRNQNLWGLNANDFAFTQFRLTETWAASGGSLGAYAIAVMSATRTMSDWNNNVRNTYSTSPVISSSVTSNFGASCLVMRGKSAEVGNYSDGADWMFMGFTSACSQPLGYGDAWDVSYPSTTWCLGCTDMNQDPRNSDDLVGRPSSGSHWHQGNAVNNSRTLIWLK